MKRLIELSAFRDLLPERTAFGACIFDFDGTLADSMWVWSDIDRKFCETYGLVLPDNYDETIVGLGFEGTAQYFIDELGLKMTVEQCCDEFNRFAYDRYATEVKLKAGAYDFLKSLRAAGMPCAIASSLNWDLLEAGLKGNGVEDCFDAICLCDNYGTHKSESLIYLTCAEKLGVDPADCLVFEDILPGVMSVNRAGMTSVALLDEGNEAQSTDKVAAAARVAIRDFTCLLRDGTL